MDTDMHMWVEEPAVTLTEDSAVGHIHAGMELKAEEIRVLGCLVEKSLATPQQYPLSLNALTLACNQSTNRDPVVSYNDQIVSASVQSLKEKKLVRFVHPSHGKSVTRYRHVVDEVLSLDEPHLAVLAVLMLRGPQTAGELRQRTERLHHFGNINEVEDVLSSLAAPPDPLVMKLARRPGEKEERWMLQGDRAATAQSATAQSSTDQSSGSQSSTDQSSGSQSSTGSLDSTLVRVDPDATSPAIDTSRQPRNNVMAHSGWSFHFEQALLRSGTYASPLSIVERTGTISAYAWIDYKLFEVIGGWVEGEDDIDLKVLFDAESRAHGWNAAMWREEMPPEGSLRAEKSLAPQDRLEADGVPTLVRPGFPQALHMLEAAGSLSLLRLGALSRVILPGMLLSYRIHQCRLSPATDGSFSRTLNIAYHDVLDMWLAVRLAFEATLCRSDSREPGGTSLPAEIMARISEIETCLEASGPGIGLLRSNYPDGDQ
ncbi:MAG: YceH family protein [Actinobacteria bacterium]|nr:YceH family protein [Actinomycetota bacterium]MCL5446941.1 YceH family protein [Actinomycetota bacterium]